MGPEDRAYTQERARQIACTGNQTDLSEIDPDPVRDAYYNPKDFRRERLHIKVPNWGSEREECESKSLGVGAVYSVFLVGIAVGFFITCLLGLLRFELFAWGLRMMQPIAKLISEY